MTTRDRLQALRMAMKSQGDSMEFSGSNNTIEAENRRNMEIFFEQADEIRGGIEMIVSNVEDVKKKHSLVLSNAINDPRIKEELDDLMTRIKQTAYKVRNKLQVMEQQIGQDEKEAEKRRNEQKPEKVGESAANLRIRKTQHNALSRKFIGIMTEYNKTQIDYREGCKRRIQRQLSIAGRNVDGEQLEEMIESGNAAVFAQGIITDTQQAKQTLADIEARHNDILKLESNIRELHDMFMDMAMFVESQGEMVDRIEYNVNNAKEYTENATKHTIEAKKWQTKARRKKFCLIVSLTVLAIVIAIILYFAIK